jgi:hypothetical protein
LRFNGDAGSGSSFDDFLRQACPDLDLSWRKYRRRQARHHVEARMRELGLQTYEAYRLTP